MNKKLEKLRIKASETIRDDRNHRESLPEGSPEPDAGHLYVFPVELEVALRFAVVLSHPDDDEMWFLVPADDFSWVGPTDIAVEDHPLSPLVLRCNHGLWLSGEDVAKGRLVGRLDDQSVENAAQMMSDMVTGQLDATKKQLETEELEEYEEWASLIHEAVAQVDTWSRRTAVVLDLDAFRSTLDQNSEEDTEQALLAAASSGIEARLQKLDEESQSPEWQVDAWEGPGELSIIFEDDALFVVFEAGVEQPPGLEAAFHDGSNRRLEWRRFPGGGLWKSEDVDAESIATFSVSADGENGIEIRFN